MISQGIIDDQGNVIIEPKPYYENIIILPNKTSIISTKYSEKINYRLIYKEKVSDQVTHIDLTKENPKELGEIKKL